MTSNRMIQLIISRINLANNSIVRMRRFIDTKWDEKKLHDIVGK